MQLFQAKDVYLPAATTHQPAERPIQTWKAAQICGVSQRAITEAVNKGRLYGFKLREKSKLWYFWRADVERYRDQRNRRRCVWPGGGIRRLINSKESY